MPKPNTNGKVKQLRASVASSVRRARAGLRLSQFDVAERAGTSPARVSELENCQADPRLSTLVRIADVLGMRVTVTESDAA